jgi:hypothetical protein
LEDWGNPLVTSFANRKEFFFPAPHSAADRKRRPATPFEDSAVPRAAARRVGFSEDAFGLLLVGGSATFRPELHWFTNVFSQKLDQILRSRRWPTATASRDASARCSTTSSTRSPIRFC